MSFPVNSPSTELKWSRGYSHPPRGSLKDAVSPCGSELEASPHAPEPSGPGILLHGRSYSLIYSLQWRRFTAGTNRTPSSWVREFSLRLRLRLFKNGQMARNELNALVCPSTTLSDSENGLRSNVLWTDDVKLVWVKDFNCADSSKRVTLLKLITIKNHQNTTNRKQQIKVLNSIRQDIQTWNRTCEH